MSGQRRAALLAVAAEWAKSGCRFMQQSTVSLGISGRAVIPLRVSMCTTTLSACLLPSAVLALPSFLLPPSCPLQGARAVTLSPCRMSSERSLTQQSLTC